MFYHKTRHVVWFLLFAVSADQVFLNFMKKIKNFKKFKKQCSKTGTTEESIAQAEKIGLKPILWLKSF